METQSSALQCDHGIFPKFCAPVIQAEATFKLSRHHLDPFVSPGTFSSYNVFEAISSRVLPLGETG